MPLPLSQEPELSPNCQAFPLVEELLARSEQLKINVLEQNGVKIIDCGVQVSGGWDAGILFASVCLGGLAKVALHRSEFNGLAWPAVEVITDHPVRACLASQYAGWPIQNGEHLAMGSGPGRASIHKGDIFKKLDYHDDSQTVILCLETEGLPNEETVKEILNVCKCKPACLYILAAPTASLAGSVQISARALETGLAKMMQLGYDLGKIVSGWSICPLPPVGRDNHEAMGRTNDAILYGSSVYFTLRDEDKNLNALVKQIPSSASRDFGQPFAEIYQGSGNFYNHDPLLFSPAVVCLNNLNSGAVFQAGSIRPDILRHSFGIS